jgi:RNA polymerase sigma-70 factor (ECF subfamily)
MNDLHEQSDLWESFKQGQTEAFRHFFHLHNYRIYYYLLRLLRNQGQAKELTRHVFVVLFNNREHIDDAEQLLRRLYLSARVCYLLSLNGKRSTADLKEELDDYAHEEAEIMDDPDIAQNETLIALQAAMQRIPPAKREVAELYFFQGLSVKAIARQLGEDEQSIRDFISETLKRLGEELPEKGADRSSLSVVRA